MKFAGKVISKRGKRIYNGLSKIQKFIGKIIRKSGQSKLEKKEHLPQRFLRLGLSRAFSLFGRVMKTHYFQRLANYVINSLLLCSPRRDSNKICESKSRKKSWTKARRKVSTQVHRFPKHFSHNSRSFEYFAFFSQQIKHNCFLLKILARFCLQ